MHAGSKALTDEVRKHHEKKTAAHYDAAAFHFGNKIESVEIHEENGLYRLLSDSAQSATKHAKKASHDAWDKTTAHSKDEVEGHKVAMKANEMAYAAHHKAHKLAPNAVRKTHHAEHMDEHDDRAGDHEIFIHDKQGPQESVNHTLVEAVKKNKSKRIRFKTPGGKHFKRRRPSNMPMRVAHAVER